MHSSENKSKLPLNIRILVGIAGLPSIVLAYMLVVTVIHEGITDISAFEVVYSIIGVVALYIAITGKRLF
ncbi:hypothetical protein [Paraglaciecola sp.]|uniref:hypothetical protein n=1 Tax=Paraglaciecola sp. TaxID=1920173 RepID=UPI0030F475F8